jgi:glutaminyl-tRNA synthetase
VRLRYAYFIKCVDCLKDPETGEVTELHCTYDPSTKGGNAPDGRKVRGTIHWVSSEHAVEAEVCLYDRLFSRANPGEGSEDSVSHLNPDSLEVLRDCMLEPSLASLGSGERVQFERQGYFCRDIENSKEDRLVFNRTVALRDSWAKIEQKQNSARV